MNLFGSLFLTHTLGIVRTRLTLESVRVHSQVGTKQANFDLLSFFGDMYSFFFPFFLIMIVVIDFWVFPFMFLNKIADLVFFFGFQALEDHSSCN